MNFKECASLLDMSLSEFYDFSGVTKDSAYYMRKNKMDAEIENACILALCKKFGVDANKLLQLLEFDKLGNKDEVEDLLILSTSIKKIIVRNTMETIRHQKWNKELGIYEEVITKQAPGLEEEWLEDEVEEITDEEFESISKSSEDLYESLNKK